MPTNDEKTFRKEQMTKNKADPLQHGEAAQVCRRELFNRFSRQATGFNHRDVAFGAGCLMLNAIRQQCKTQRAAEAMFDEYATYLKRSLMDDHYDSSGKRKSVFPHTQILQAELHTEKQKFYN